MKLSEFDDAAEMVRQYRALHNMTLGAATARLVDATGRVTVDLDLPLPVAQAVMLDSFARLAHSLAQHGVEVDA